MKDMMETKKTPGFLKIDIPLENSLDKECEGPGGSMS
jgi:hypothetical protein